MSPSGPKTFVLPRKHKLTLIFNLLSTGLNAISCKKRNKKLQLQKYMKLGCNSLIDEYLLKLKYKNNLDIVIDYSCGFMVTALTVLFFFFTYLYINLCSQCSRGTATSQRIWITDQMTGIYVIGILTLNGLIGHSFILLES